MPFNEDIVKRAMANSYFREVLATGPHSQVVVMSIPPGGDIGEEVHDDVDQTAHEARRMAPPGPHPARAGHTVRAS
jgi:hypothetical protein